MRLCALQQAFAGNANGLKPLRVHLPQNCTWLSSPILPSAHLPSQVTLPVLTGPVFLFNRSVSVLRRIAEGNVLLRAELPFGTINELEFAECQFLEGLPQRESSKLTTYTGIAIRRYARDGSTRDPASGWKNAGGHGVSLTYSHELTEFDLLRINLMRIATMGLQATFLFPNR